MVHLTNKANMHKCVRHRSKERQTQTYFVTPGTSSRSAKVLAIVKSVAALGAVCPCVFYGSKYVTNNQNGLVVRKPPSTLECSR